jgi:hypothetical protein
LKIITKFSSMAGRLRSQQLSCAAPHPRSMDKKTSILLWKLEHSFPKNRLLILKSEMTTALLKQDISYVTYAISSIGCTVSCLLCSCFSRDFIASPMEVSGLKFEEKEASMADNTHVDKLLKFILRRYRIFLQRYT